MSDRRTVFPRRAKCRSESPSLLPSHTRDHIGPSLPPPLPLDRSTGGKCVKSLWKYDLLFAYLCRVFFFILSFFFIRLFFSKVGGSSWTLLVYFASEYYSFDYACRSEKRDSSRIFPMTEEKKTYALFSCNGISSLELKDLMTILILPRIYNLTFKSLWNQRPIGTFNIAHLPHSKDRQN